MMSLNQVDTKSYRVLAWFSWLKAGGIMFVASAMLVGLYAMPFVSDSGSPIQYLRDHPRWAGFIIAAWLAGLYFFRLVIAISKQLFFRNCAAIWLANGFLIYLRPQNRTDVRDIADISLDIFKSYGVSKQVVTVVRRDGTQQLLPVGLLSEPPDVVFARLKEELGLSSRD